MQGKIPCAVMSKEYSSEIPYTSAIPYISESI